MSMTDSFFTILSDQGGNRTHRAGGSSPPLLLAVKPASSLLGTFPPTWSGAPDEVLSRHSRLTDSIRARSKANGLDVVRVGSQGHFIFTTPLAASPTTARGGGESRGRVLPFEELLCQVQCRRGTVVGLGMQPAGRLVGRLGTGLRCRDGGVGRRRVVVGRFGRVQISPGGPDRVEHVVEIRSWVRHDCLLLVRAKSGLHPGVEPGRSWTVGFEPTPSPRPAPSEQCSRRLPVWESNPLVPPGCAGGRDAQPPTGGRRPSSRRPLD
jgi:hypothetical protein